MPAECDIRRTFAIISHPDAGKTTLTEKFLLYGGAVQLAGSVTSRKNQRAATSDWMELEKQRGISVTSTVLQFDYLGYRVNLLDTPGHKDFSDDTYRVLTAVDAVIMMIDAGKGIEAQTRKLFEICRLRKIPIFTFMNKLDRPSRDPLELLDELESQLELEPCAMNWPLGSGPDFRGVFDRIDQQVHLFERVPGGSFRAPVEVRSIEDKQVEEVLEPGVYQKTVDDLEVLEAGHEFDRDAMLEGRLTPVFFGSASNNFGVQLLLDAALKNMPPPAARKSGERVIPLDDKAFSAFVFKIQANMDPKHRDRVAFVRICSGKFERDMSVTHVQSGKKIRLKSSHKLFARERETVDEAWPGDVIGLVGHSGFGIGDTLTQDTSILYSEIPRFTPEHFAHLHSTSTSQFKKFRDGLSQLLQEGVIQSFLLRDSATRTPLLGAVGPLQFDVVRYRLESEYGADSRLEPSKYSVLRWVSTSVDQDALDEAIRYGSAALAHDPDDKRVLLFPDKWSFQYFCKEHPEIELSEILTED